MEFFGVVRDVLGRLSVCGGVISVKLTVTDMLSAPSKKHIRQSHRKWRL